MAATTPSPMARWSGHGYQALGDSESLDLGGQDIADPEPEPEPRSTWPRTPTEAKAPTPTSAATELPPYPYGAKDLFHQASPVLIDAELPWRPRYLRRRVLGCFAGVFALILIAIETLLAVSDKNYGIASSSADLHYLWTYGPTAFLTLVAALWSRSEYQSKLVAPWVRLSTHPSGSHAKRTLLLDYISDFQLSAVFKSLRNRDFTVSLTSTVAILIKVLIVISTGLISLSWTQVYYSSWPVTIQDRFVDNPARLSHAGTLAYFVTQGLANQNLTYPEGISAEYAYQSVGDGPPSTAETTVTVDGFGNSLDCQPAELILRGAAPPDPHYADQVMNLTVKSPSCTMQNLKLHPAPVWLCRNEDSCDVQFARFVETRCDGIKGDSGRRILVMSGNLTYSLDKSVTLKDYTGQGKRHPYLSKLVQSAQVLCVPTYGITRVNVVRNGTQTLNVTAVPGASRRTLDSVTAWNLMDAHYSSFSGGSLDRGRVYGKTIEVGGITVDVDDQMGFALPMLLAPDQSPSALVGQKTLQQLATSYYAQVGAIIAKQSLMEPASIPSEASVIMLGDRLVIRSWAAQWMAGLSAICVVLVVIAAFLVPRRGILPCSPATLPGMASLVGHSPNLLAMLRFAGAADAKNLGRPLLNSTFRSGVVIDPVSSRPRFTILSQLKNTDRKSLTFPQVSSRHKHPGVLHPAFRLALCLFLVMLIVTLELTLRKSDKDGGLGDVGDDSYIHYTWTAVPAVAFGALSMLFSTVDFQVRSLAPYVALRNGVSAKTYSTLDLMDMSVPRTMFREIKFGNPGALAATTSFLVASVFTMFSASLFQSLAMPETVPITLRAVRSFDIRQYDAEQGNAIASLVFASNYSFPRFTYDDLAFPELTPTHPLPIDGAFNESTVLIDAVVPAVRATLQCRVYDSSDITTNLTLDYSIPFSNYDNPLGINIRGEECGRSEDLEEYAYNNILSTYPNTTYFGLGDGTSIVSNVQGCSNVLYTWGKLDFTANPIIQHITAVGCNETVQTLSVNATFVGTNLTIDAGNPPVPLENTAHPSTIQDLNIDSPYLHLAHPGAGDEGANLDAFFAMLTTSPWAIPVASLGNPAATDAIMAAIKRHHGIIQAQSFAQRMSPSNATNTTIPQPDDYVPPPPYFRRDGRANTPRQETRQITDDVPRYRGTASTPPFSGRRRVAQDRASTRVLQALLGVAAALVLTGWACMRGTDALPRRPTTVASVAALVAGGNLFEKEFSREIWEAKAAGGNRWGEHEGGEEDNKGRWWRRLSGIGNTGNASTTSITKNINDGGETGVGKKQPLDLNGVRFWMGWGTVTDWEGREVGGGENEAGVSRFGIFVIRSEDEKEGDIGWGTTK